MANRQILPIREFCDEHGLILEQVYVDEAKVSSDSEKRIQYNQMMTDLMRCFPQIRNLDKRKKIMEQRPFGVIVWKSNRLGRDQIETTYLKAELRLRGMTIITLISRFETGDPSADALLELIQQQHDERHLQETAENSQRGLAELVTLRDNDPDFRLYNPDWPTHDGRYLGIVPGVTPKGFKNEVVMIGAHDRQKGEKHLVKRIVPNHDEHLWERCRLAWQMRVEGVGIKKIMLATQLFSTPSGYDHFFRNRIYIGILDYGGMTLENFVEPLIPREWFDIVQQKREAFAAKRRKQQADPMHEPRRLGSRHLLSGLVFCGAVSDHEHPMNADTVPPKGKKPRWDHYLCTVMKNTRSQRCQAPRIGAAALDHAVIDRLLTDILTVAHLRPIADELGKAVHDRNREVEGRIMGVEGRLEEVKRSIQTLLDALERAGFSPNIQARLREREQEERRLLAELINLQSLLVAPRDIPKVTDQQIEDWIESVRTALTGADVEEARRVLRQFVAKIVIKEKAGTLYYTFPLSALSRLHPVIPSGYAPYPRYFTATFVVSRRKRSVNPRPPTPAQMALQQHVHELRMKGWSFPAIARELHISVGTAWNLANKG